MNKTININLANTFFHIDEDAYNKLQRYLDAIKRSFTNKQGRDEIIADIEARIAELFTEKLQHERQVISFKEVDEVIAVMGQPEDYLVDEEIFDEDQKPPPSKSKKGKQLFRDIDNKYISGVSSGLGHYLGIDALWIRLIWILFTLFSGGTFIFAYILFWILVPEATTTAQKLAMKGEPINISNIEKKIKEGFDDVAEKVKNVDYGKVKSNSKNFFDSLGDVLIVLFKVIGKFIGIILLVTAASVLLSLFIGLFTAGTIDIFGGGYEWEEYVNMATDVPLWFISILVFFAVGIPFFFLFYLGLKILVSNLKSIGNIAKFSLLGLWVLSIISLITLGVRAGMQQAYNGHVSVKKELYVTPADTLTITMNEIGNYDNVYHGNHFQIMLDENGTKKLYSKAVNFNIKKSEDSIAYIKVDQRAKGNSYENARENAKAIEYNYFLSNKHLKFDDFSLSEVEHKFRDQQIDIDIYIPEGQTIFLDKTAKYNLGYHTENNMGYHRNELINHLWEMGEDNELKCLDCEDEKIDIDENKKAGININMDDDENHVKIDEDGIDINVKDDDGDEFKMKIDEDGIKIKTN